MKNKRVTIGIAAVMAVVGAIILVVFVRGAEDRALEGEELVTVLVRPSSRSPPARRRRRSKDLVTTEQIPAKIAPRGRHRRPGAGPGHR